MIKNPIVVGGIKLPTLTNPGTAADLLADKQLIDQEGNPLTGTMPTKAATDLIINGATVTVPAGYYAADASKSVATATQATPAISVSSAGLITASSTQAAGYVAAGTKSATKQLTTKAAATITPGTADQSIAAGQYLTGAQTIKGDANLLAENIKSGVSIFGVAGSFVGSNNAYVIQKTYSVDTIGTISFTDLPFTPSFCFVISDLYKFLRATSGITFLYGCVCTASDGKILAVTSKDSTYCNGGVSLSGYFTVSDITATINLNTSKAVLYFCAGGTYTFCFY